jgi:N-carbamoylputrescine amidase
LRITVAAIQIPCVSLDIQANVDRADHWLRRASEAGAQITVLPEMFNTGYGLCPDYGPYAEDAQGRTLRHLRDRALRWKMGVAAGFVERAGKHLHDSLAFVTPEGNVHVYRKRHLVFWERFRFYPGRAPLVVPTRWGRIGLAICADMIYRRVWQDYRDQIDLAIISAAWPDFADRETGRKHWLFGHVGPLSAAIPGRVAEDLGIPVIFANQCGETRTTIPVLRTTITDRFAGRSSVSDGRHGPPITAGSDEQMILSSVTIHPQRGLKSWRFTSPSAPAASSFVSGSSSFRSSGESPTGEPAEGGP